jgi:hypothetical protein
MSSPIEITDTKVTEKIAEVDEGNEGEEYITLDLRNVKYDIKTLEKYVDDIHMKTCVNTQILTAEYCVKYVLNEDYMSCIEDTYCIDTGYVLKRQPHLTYAEIRHEYSKINDGKGYSHGI